MGLKKGIQRRNCAKKKPLQRGAFAIKSFIGFYESAAAASASTFACVAASNASLASANA
jgi:hypothetical protein